MSHVNYHIPHVKTQFHKSISHLISSSSILLSSTSSECVCSLGSQFRRGAGVLDMVFESPFQLFTCGYDTFIRLWDLRLSPRYTTISLLRGSTLSAPQHYAAIELFYGPNIFSSTVYVSQCRICLLNSDTYSASDLYHCMLETKGTIEDTVLSISSGNSGSWQPWGSLHSTVTNFFWGFWGVVYWGALIPIF